MKRFLTRYQLTIYLGILAFLSLITTVILGITGANFGLHKKFGIATLVLALVHISPTVYNRIKLIKRRNPK